MKLIYIVRERFNKLIWSAYTTEAQAKASIQEAIDQSKDDPEVNFNEGTFEVIAIVLHDAVTHP